MLRQLSPREVRLVSGGEVVFGIDGGVATAYSSTGAVIDYVGPDCGNGIIYGEDFLNRDYWTEGVGSGTAANLWGWDYNYGYLAYWDNGWQQWSGGGGGC